MAETLGEMLQSINSSELRISLEKILGILGFTSDTKVGSVDLTGDLTGDVTGNLTGNVTGDVTGDVTGSATKINAGDTPVNAVYAQGTVTLTDGITQGETLVIGDDTYEFDIDETGVTAGNIAVPLVTGSVTKEDGAASLETVATASGTEAVTVVDNLDGTLTVTSDLGGVIGMTIAFEATGAHVAVDQYDATDYLGGTTEGVDGTAAGIGTILFDAAYLYVAKAEQTIYTDNWRRIALDDF